MSLCSSTDTTYIAYDICQISSSHKTHTATQSSVMRIGRNSRKFKYRILIKFNFNHLPKNVRILRSTLSLNVLSTAPKHKTHELTVYTLNSNWSISTVNWNNQPPINFTNKLFKKSVDNCKKYTFDLTDQVRNWYENPSTNYGMVLIGSEDVGYNKMQIRTKSGSSNNLSLLVEYYVEQKIPVVVEPTKFFEYPEDITISPDVEYFTTSRDISLAKIVAYFVKNNNIAPIKIVFEYSPDDINFMKEDRIISITAGANQVLFPIWFSKYIRLSITASPGGNTATINTWLQLQQ